MPPSGGKKYQVKEYPHHTTEKPIQSYTASSIIHIACPRTVKFVKSFSITACIMRASTNGRVRDNVPKNGLVPGRFFIEKEVHVHSVIIFCLSTCQTLSDGAVCGVTHCQHRLEYDIYTCRWNL